MAWVINQVPYTTIAYLHLNLIETMLLKGPPGVDYNNSRWVISTANTYSSFLKQDTIDEKS